MSTFDEGLDRFRSYVDSAVESANARATSASLARDEALGLAAARLSDLNQARIDLAGAERETARLTTELEQAETERDAAVKAFADHMATHQPARPKILFGADAAGYPKEVGRPGPVPGQYETPEQAYRRIEPALGGLDFIRSWPGLRSPFWSGFPAYWRPGMHFMPNLGSGLGVAQQLARGDLDSQIRQIAETAPEGVRTYLTICHEPEDDGIGCSLWAAGQRKAAEVLQKVGRPDVVLVPTVMNATFKPDRYRSGEKLKANELGPKWFDPIGTDVPWVAGLDAYQWGQEGKSIDTAEVLLKPAFDYFAGLSRHVVFPEFGARGGLTDQHRADLIDDVTAYIKKRTDVVVEAIAYYESVRGQLGFWNLTPQSPLATAAWKRMRQLNA